MTRGDWYEYSAPAGKVVSVARIISSGHEVTDFEVFKPASPNNVFGTYTFGANEYGWVLKAKTGSGLTALSNVQIEMYYCDLVILTTTSVPGYEVVTSPVLSLNAGDWTDVRCPLGKVPLRAKFIQNADEVRPGGYTVYEDFAVFNYAY